MVNIKSYIYLVFAGALAGLIGVFVKLIGSNIHFMSIMFYRMFFGLLALFLIIPFLDKKWYKVAGEDLRHYLVVAVLMTATFSLFVVANVFAPVQNVVLITNIAPFLVLILSYFFLKEKITKVKIITLIIAIVGIIILNPFNFGENMLGNYLAMGQAVLYAFLIVLMRKENKEHTIGAVLWFFIFSTIILLPFVFIFGFGDLTEVWPYVLGIGIFSTGLTYLFHNLGLQKVGAEIGSIIVMIIMPLTGIIVAMIVLGEKLNLRILVGGIILMVAGTYLQVHENKLRGAIKRFFAGW